MNTYIATLDNQTIGTITDMPEHHSLVMDILGAYLQAGASIHLNRNGVTAPVQVIQAAPKTVKPIKKPAKEETRLMPPPAWSVGARVFLKWSVIKDIDRVTLSTYRTTPGVVVELRRGTGIQKQVGVRFNEDPELTWLRPAELSGVPEVSL